MSEIEIAALTRGTAANSIFDATELFIDNNKWETFGVKFPTGSCSGPCLKSSDFCVDDVPFVDPVGFSWATQRAFRAEFSVRCNPVQFGDPAARKKFFEDIRVEHEGMLHKALAAGLWDGMAPATGLVDVPAANVVTVTGDHVVSVVGNLVQRMSSKGSGSSGVLHMSPYVATLAADRGIVYRQGNRLRTVVGDHLVIADGGYSGDGPGGVAASATSQWIYATGPIFYAVGESTFPAGYDFTKYIDRGSNTLVVPVETSLLAVFDPCFWFAGEVKLTCGLVCE
jgi:hypothetical protein